MAARYPLNIQQQQEAGRLGGGGGQQAAPAFFYSPQPLYGSYPTQLTPQQLFALQQQQQQHIFLQQHNTTAAQQSYHQQQQQQQFILSQQQQQQQAAAATALLQRAGNRAVAGHPQMATSPHQQVRPGVVLHPPHRMLAGAAGGLPAQPGKHLGLGILPSQPQALLAGVGPSAVPGAADLTSIKGKLEVEDEYGLQPLLRVIMPQPPMSTAPSLPHPSEEVNPETGRTPSQHAHDQANFLLLTRGFDLNLLGLQVSQHEQLHPTIATLALDEHQYYVFPDFRIPDCYKKPKPKPLSMKSFLYFKEKTLFYIFYSMPRDVLHLAAARALYERGWRYHKKDQQWFRPALRGADGTYVAYHSPEAATAVREEVVVENYRGQHGVRAFVGTYEIFEPAFWRVSRTAPDYVVLVSDIEEHTVLQAAMEEAARQQQRTAATTATTMTPTPTPTTSTATGSDAGALNKP